jgi:hypothetical protein
MMTTEKIYVGIDDERVEATGKVLEQILLDRQKFEKQEADKKAEAQTKATAKAALLIKLGITEAEAELLLA